jgi:MoxR-like ATPase
MKELLQQVIDKSSEIILGKTDVIRYSLTCLLAGGHLLIEDVPGVGKTTLSHTLAKLLGLDYQRIQFTSDLLPSDIIGISIFDRNTSNFHFNRGPVFTQVLLADEINRATPRAQSALLEAMEEKQVSVDGETMRLPHPFFVIATQNPNNQIGTFPLPESQLDRFLMTIKIGFPDHKAEKDLLKGKSRKSLLDTIDRVLSPAELMGLQEHVTTIHASDAIIDYCLALVRYSRESKRFIHGLSPRAGLAILSAAKAWAYLNNREMVIPEDVQDILYPVCNHRLYSNDQREAAETNQITYLIKSVPLP